MDVTVPVEHLKCLTEGCPPPMAYEPGRVLGCSGNKFDPRAPIASSERFHKVATNVIPAAQQKSTPTHHTERMQRYMLIIGHVIDSPCEALYLLSSMNVLIPSTCLINAARERSCPNVVARCSPSGMTAPRLSYSENAPSGSSPAQSTSVQAEYTMNMCQYGLPEGS